MALDNATSIRPILTPFDVAVSATPEAGPRLVYVQSPDGTVKPTTRVGLMADLERVGRGLQHLDLPRMVDKVLSGVAEHCSERDFDEWIIRVAAMMMSEEPEYSRLAARLLSEMMDRELSESGVTTFVDSLQLGSSKGLVAQETLEFAQEHAAELEAGIQRDRQDLFEYFGLKTVYDRYLLREPSTRKIIEHPQHFFMRVSCGLSRGVEEALDFYRLISSFEYMPATPTLFNAGTNHPQMSSCYLLDSPQDDLEAIYGKYRDIALLSKFAGGIGVSFSRIRGRGSLIRGTNGQSNGIIPFLKTLDSSVSAVNQGGKRKGAACVYLETWHTDIMEFLQLRDNTGDEAQRTHNLNIANWIPDLFMRRVEADEEWSLFDPKLVPDFPDLYGEAFDKAYMEAEKAGIASATVRARDLYTRMMKTLAQTGNGWVTFKDASNLKSNQTDGSKDNVIHLSNLCTEILEVTKDGQTAVCNLGSIQLGRYIENGAFDFAKMRRNVRLAVRYLDRIVDINFYPIGSAKSSNSMWRPVGLGVMGLQNAFFQLGFEFDSAEARSLSQKIQEEIYFEALWESSKLAKELGAHETFSRTKAAKGIFQFELWGRSVEDAERWEELRAHIREHGLRNSLLISIAPTATIASITGAYECIEPQVSNLFKRETLSGEFLQVNPYLVKDLRKIGLWNQSIKSQIKAGEGSVQHIEEIPASIRSLYRTTWEIPQRALIDLAADRGAFIDQSQSLNLFMASPNLGKVSSMYAYAWKRGLKTTYYLRSRGATRITQTTTAQNEQAVACSLENPESCESCT